MPVNNVNNSSFLYGTTSAYEAAKSQNATAEAAEKMAEEAKEAEGTAKQKEDGFVKQAAYKPDTQKIYEMKADLGSKMSAFKMMVQGMFQKQGGYANQAGLIQITDDMRLAAEEAISEDGEWGVEKTAQRILDFAKALSGGDPSKISLLKDAVEKGFKEAERILGGKLPEISQKTYDRVMQGFADWEAEANGTAAAQDE